jgi:hypothetical protein
LPFCTFSISHPINVKYVRPNRHGVKFRKALAHRQRCVPLGPGFSLSPISVAFVVGKVACDGVLSRCWLFLSVTFTGAVCSLSVTCPGAGCSLSVTCPGAGCSLSVTCAGAGCSLSVTFHRRATPVYRRLYVTSATDSVSKQHS